LLRVRLLNSSKLTRNFLILLVLPSIINLIKIPLSKKLTIIAILFSLFQVNGQELPPVMNFGPNQYNAGNQNWMIDQDQKKNLYFANSTGLLEYNGENWNLYPVPNNTIVRSLKIVGERIYTGAYMEAGYWDRDDFGILKYTSLVSEFPNTIGDGEQFWDIEFVDDLIIFRSFGGIYFYDPQKDQVSMLENSFGKPISGIFNHEGELFFQLVGEGLFKVLNGKPQLVVPFSQLNNRAVVHIYNKDANLSIITGNSEFFNWNGKQLIQYNEELSEALGTPNVLDVLVLENGEIILGTVGKGIVQVSSEGQILNTFDQENILINNTVLDLFLDDSGNIWAGMDYGMSNIDLSSAFLSFQDNRGEIGSVYASFKENGNLYLGTNQGLYLKRANDGKFNLIEGTSGQVWFIEEIEGNLFCGHNSGTFLIDGNEATKISDRLGTWLVKKYSENTFVQGHYNGISFLKNENGAFTTMPMLANFPHSSKFIEVDTEGHIWISNEHKGVFRLMPNDSLSNIKDIRNYKFQEESGITSSLFRYKDTLYYSSRENIYQYQELQDDFQKDNSLNKLISNVDRVSGKISSEDSRQRIWGFAREGIFTISPARLNNSNELDFIYIDQDFRNIAVGYENISDRNDGSNYVLGIANGYIKFDLSKTGLNRREYNIDIDKIEVSSLDSPLNQVALNKPGSFQFKKNNISFLFSAPVHNKFSEAVYSYRLKGLSDKWSNWSSTPEVNFKNLNFGDYTFEVKAKIGNYSTNTAVYDFKIDRPFYLSNSAILGYFLIFLLILFLIHLLNRRHHKRSLAQEQRALKMKNLEAEQEIIQLRNEKLEQDMANKNRELAVSTMSLIKKNEFLTSIKEKLKNSGDTAKVKSVIKTIDKDISEEDNWKFFKKAFSNADKDFFKKVKAKHPELTSNDLKLCAYLRLNLSSKEIAPLLNISVKSVEIKRYRLRKKMELDREVNLTDYILSL